MKVMDLWRTAEAFTKKNSPVILAGLALGGFVISIVSAFKAGSRAEEILEARKRDLEDVAPGDKEAIHAVNVETVKKMAPVVAPPVIMGLASSACLVGSVGISHGRMIALQAAYSVAENSLRDMNGMTEKLLGKKKAREIRDNIMKEKLKNDSSIDSKVVITGNGDVICKDMFTGRYFSSNAQKIGQAINELSARVLGEMYVSLNDFYDLIGLGSVTMGDRFGWGVDDLSGGVLPISFTALLTNDNQPCLCIDYDARLRRDFSDLC